MSQRQGDQANNNGQGTFGGQILGWLMNMGIDAVQGLPQDVINRMQGMMEDMARKGQAYGMDKIRALVNPQLNIQIMAAVLNEFLERVLFQQQDHIPPKIKQGCATLYKIVNQRYLENKDVEDKDQTREVAVLLEGVWQSYYAFQQAYRNSALKFWEANDNFDEDKRNKLVEELANTMYGNFLQNEAIILTKDQAQVIINSVIVNENYNQGLIDAVNDATDLDGKKLQLALLNGADPNFIATDGLSVLHKAILNNNFAQVKILLEMGANPNQVATQPNKPSIDGKNNWRGWSPVHMAAFENRSGILALLVQHGADVSTKVQVGLSNKKPSRLMDYDGHTALTLALLNKPFKGAGYTVNADQQTQTVMQLINANPSLVNQSVTTNYNQAVSAKRDWRGWSPLGIVAQNWEKNIPDDAQQKMVQAMIAAGADPNQQMQNNFDTWQGFSPMHVLAYNKHGQVTDQREKLFKIMIEHGNGDVNLKTGANADPLYRNKTALALVKNKNLQSAIQKMPKGIKPLAMHNQHRLFKPIPAAPKVEQRVEQSFIMIENNNNQIESNNNNRQNLPDAKKLMDSFKLLEQSDQHKSVSDSWVEIEEDKSPRNKK